MSHPSHAVFISCAPNLMALARAVQRHLNARGRRAEIEEPRRGEGPDWLRRVARRRTQAHALLILLSKETPWAWQLAAQAEAARAKALRPELRVAPVLFDGYEAVALQAICPALQPFHLPPTSRSLDEALEALSAWLEAAPPPPLPPTALIPKRLSPYPFEEAHRFFGRDAEIVEGLKRLHGEGAPRWLSVEGPAGVGKRSFIQAGLLPTILRGGLPLAPRAWAWARLAACRDPLAGLAVALARGLGDDARAEELGALLREEGGLLDIITEHLPADQGLVLIIEGLDALPRLALDPEAPQRLDAMLAAALSGFDQRLLLLTDGAARGLPRLEGLIKEGRGARLELGAPTLDGLRAIIEGTGYGRAWPKALIDRLLSDAAHALPPEGGARALGPLSWALDALAAQPNARLDQYLAQGRGALAGALDARFNALAIDERARARALLLALIHSGRGAPDEPITLTMEEAVRCAGEGPRAAQLIEALSEPSEAAPPLLRLYHGPPQLVGLHHPALLVWWPRLRSWLEMDRPALERRRDAEALAARLPPGGALDLAGLHFCQGADLLDEHRAHLQGLLSAPTRRLIEEAQAAEAARAHAAMEREALKAEATRQRHQEALRRAARRAGRLRWLSVALTAGLCLFGVITYRAVEAEGELESQLSWAQRQRLQALAQLRRVEAANLDAEDLRKAAEAQRREMEVARRAALGAATAAAQDADEVLSLTIEIIAAADAHLARLRGKEAEYTRRMYADAIIERLEARLAQGTSPRLQVLLAHQQAQAAKEALERGAMRRALPLLEAAIKGLIASPPTPERRRALVTHTESLARALEREHKLGRGEPAAVEAAYRGWVEALGRVAAQPEATAADQISLDEGRARWGRVALRLEMFEVARAAAEARLDALGGPEVDALRRAEALSALVDVLSATQAPSAAQRGQEALDLTLSAPPSEDRAKLEARLRRKLKALAPH